MESGLDSLHRSLSLGYELSETELMALHQDHIDYFEKHGNAADGTPGVIEVQGVNPGPHLVFSGGIHGNETAGVESAVKVHQHLMDGRLTLKNGSISFLLGNPEAYRLRKRFMVENLNRMFAHAKMPNHVEGQRAWEMMKYINSIRDKLGVIFDMHSVSRDDFSMGIYNRANPNNLKLIQSLPKAFKYYFGFLSEHLEGTFMDVASLYEADGWAAECGHHEAPMTIDRAIYYIKLTCEHYGIELEGEWPRIENMVIKEHPDPIHYHTIDRIVPYEGMEFTIPGITTGTRLAAGEVFAKIENNGSSRAIAAPQACDVVMPSRIIDPKDYDAGFLAVRI